MLDKANIWKVLILNHTSATAVSWPKFKNWNVLKWIIYKFQTCFFYVSLLLKFWVSGFCWRTRSLRSTTTYCILINKQNYEYNLNNSLELFPAVEFSAALQITIDN